jgi:hypothetical protein
MTEPVKVLSGYKTQEQAYQVLHRWAKIEKLDGYRLANYLYFSVNYCVKWGSNQL